MNYLETLLTQAQYEVKIMRDELKKLKDEPVEFAHGYQEGYQACERFYTQPNPYLPVGYTVSEVPKVEPWDTEDAKIRRFSYDCGFQDGVNASKVVEKQPWENPQPQVGQIASVYPAMFGGKPAEEWITEYRSTSNEHDIWHRSGDSGLDIVFNSEKAAQAAVDEEAPRCVNIVRRVRRVD